MIETATKMMSKQTVFLLAVLAIASGAQIKPADLVDEALEQLDQLKQIVKGDIITAHDNLNNILLEFGTHSSQVINKGLVDLQQEHDTVAAELQSVKDLAHSAGVDPSPCTNQREDFIHNLPEWYYEKMVDCSNSIFRETRRITDGAKYIVDVSVNTVDHLEYQVRRCREDLLCIAPLLNEIELNKIRLPQNIKTEVQAADSTTTTLRLSTDSCATDKIAAYATEANSILRLIESCINQIIG